MGGTESKFANLPLIVSHVEKLHLCPNEPKMMGLASDTTVQKIRVLTEVSKVFLYIYVGYMHINVCTCTFLSSVHLHGMDAHQ